MKSADRLVQILYLFTEVSPYHSVGSVSQATGLATSSSHALLSSLVDAGILQRHGRRAFCLGPVVTQLAGAVGQVPPVRAFARQSLSELARKTQDRVMLLVRRDRTLIEDSCDPATFPLAVQENYLDAVNRNRDSELHRLFGACGAPDAVVIDQSSVRGVVCLGLRLPLANMWEPTAVAVAAPESRHLSMRRAYTALLTACVAEIEQAANGWPGLSPAMHGASRTSHNGHRRENGAIEQMEKQG